MIITLLVLSVTPLVLAEEGDDDGDVDIPVEEPEEECPEIYQDHTQRSWYPNDQTIYTATEYGTPYTNCYGDAYFDADTNTWHYIYQCMDRNIVWNMCHSSHVGDNPLVLFDYDSNNPIVQGGDLWSQICQPGDDCYDISGGGVFDEGTPQIIEKRSLSKAKSKIALSSLMLYGKIVVFIPIKKLEYSFLSSKSSLIVLVASSKAPLVPLIRL